jgi:hypothetical protein
VRARRWRHRGRPGTIDLIPKETLMRNRLLLCFACLLLCVAGSAAAVNCSDPAYAPTVTFGGNCSWSGGTSNANCVFSTSHTNPGNPSVTACPNSTISQVFWDFGDGNSVFGSTTASHSYVDPASLTAVQVDVSLFCADGCTADTTRYVCFNIGFAQCILMNHGWN